VAFVATQIAQRLPGIALLLLDFAKDPASGIALVTQVILMGLNAVFMLVAGLWAIRTQRLAQMDRWIRVVASLWIGQVLLTSLLFSARRVGELSYARPEGYLSMYAVGIAGGLYLAILLWRPSPAVPDSSHLAPSGGGCN
jgi:hypothetical protein